jgi:hypothetical protein
MPPRTKAHRPHCPPGPATGSTARKAAEENRRPTRTVRRGRSRRDRGP